MSDPICISFTPSREYADAMRQDRNTVDRRGYGATAGDTWHRGYRSYDVIDPFAKSREPEQPQPITCPGWRAIVDKARRDSERFTREFECKSVVWTDAERGELISIARELDEYVINKRASEGSIF